MDYGAFLNKVIKCGIEAAKRDYGSRGLKAEGAVLGFMECRHRSMLDIEDLLEEAVNTSERKIKDEDYWYWRCRALEIEWVWNLVGAWCLINSEIPIHSPTARGMMEAVEIIKGHNLLEGGHTKT